jgi:hypothetical protein
MPTRNIVSETAMIKIKKFLSQSGNEIDIVLFCDRSDVYGVELIDRQIFLYLSKHFGSDIWRNTILVITRAGIFNPAHGFSYEEFLAKRTKEIKQAAVEAGCPISLPTIFVENLRSRVGRDKQLILPDGTAWLPNLLECMTRHIGSTVSPYKYDPKQEKRVNPNRKYRHLIPVIFVVELFIKELINKSIVGSNKADKSLKGSVCTIFIYL